MEHPHTDTVATPPRRDHIVVLPGVCGGKPHVAGHRVKVQHIAIWHQRMGKSPDEIAAEHGLTLADVYAALTCYYDLRDQIDADIAADERFVAEQKAKAGRSTLQDALAGMYGQDDPLSPR